MMGILMTSSDMRTSLALHLISNMGNLQLGKKSDLLPSLENLSAAKSEAPAVTDNYTQWSCHSTNAEACGLQNFQPYLTWGA